MYFLRRPGQALLIGSYRLVLLAATPLCSHWCLQADPTEVAVHKAAGPLTYGLYPHATYFSKIARNPPGFSLWG